MSIFIPPSATSLGVYGSTDGSEGTYTSTPVDFSTTPFNSYPETRPSNSATEELYNIKNTYPNTITSTNRIPFDSASYTPSNIPTKPTDNRQPSYPGHEPTVDVYENNRYPYPSQGPDPFPEYHPMYQYPLLFHSHNDKGHFNPDVYAQNAPSLNDKYYPPPPVSSENGFGSNVYGGRYPEPELNTVNYGNINRYPEHNSFGARQPDSNSNGNIGNNGYFVSEESQEAQTKRELFFHKYIIPKAYNGTCYDQ